MSIGIDGISDSARTLFEGWQNGTAAPLVSTLLADLDESTAYQVQAEYVRLRLLNETTAGFKVGATSAAVRQALDLDAPLTGVLFGSGEYRSGASIDSSQFTSLLIETELAFRTEQIIDAPIRDLADLKVAMSTLIPVFELAETGFYGPQRSSGLDMISANSACAGFVLGKEFPAASFDPDQQTVALSLDDEELYQARSDQTFGSQWLALQWLINAMVSQGYRIEPGQVFLTGALGQPQPGKPGHYRADYGALGTVEFELT